MVGEGGRPHRLAGLVADADDEAHLHLEVELAGDAGDRRVVARHLAVGPHDRRARGHDRPGPAVEGAGQLPPVGRQVVGAAEEAAHVLGVGEGAVEVDEVAHRHRHEQVDRPPGQEGGLQPVVLGPDQLRQPLPDRAHHLLPAGQEAVERGFLEDALGQVDVGRTSRPGRAPTGRSPAPPARSRRRGRRRPGGPRRREGSRCRTRRRPRPPVGHPNRPPDARRVAWWPWLNDPTDKAGRRR